MVFDRAGWGGIEAHVMSPLDRGRFCFEMAKLLATAHDDDGVILWLGRAAEAGFDIRSEIGTARELDPYRKDTRVALLVHNAKLMRAGPVVPSGPAPALPPEMPII